MQDWKSLYKEHATLLTDKATAVRWIDLWHNQVNFLTTEHPFPTPAVFLSYRTLSTVDVSNKVQNVRVQVDVYLYYETFADTYRDSFNQDSALNFIDLMDTINAAFHGSEGENYSSMRRLGFAPVDTGNAGNLYRISYECTLMDYSAVKAYDDHEIKDLAIEQNDTPYDVS
ncbi:conserved hypothetical protein [Formosa agariphila KMM 3901]|uniref:Uncharacterized protein n=1 Tax=Formosa agariphila (strain DSM 15362 / KCTC 12365 / LMG 23005 / KMM 3901 / M-2Alg 35-1) TaxID=1347342 RepID=T2KPA0_FORAG|nr:hypothetical protein [Formosa agariphila]CDF80585.1 conserved hypothetical protein [Formosa agariphila KMM 3901]